MAFLDRDTEIGIRRGNLPHWRQDGALYFVTFRTADSLPSGLLQSWMQERDEWLRANPAPRGPAVQIEYWERFPNRLQRWLDHGTGSCPLRDPDLAQIVRSTLTHFDGERYRLDEYVVAPNHVHVLVETCPGVDLSKVLHSWKSYSAKQINHLLARRGPFWQRECFDHIVRSEESLKKFRAYIRAHDVESPAVTET